MFINTKSRYLKYLKLLLLKYPNENNKINISEKVQMRWLLVNNLLYNTNTPNYFQLVFI